MAARPCWTPPKPDSVDCSECDSPIVGRDLAIAWDAAIAHITSIAGTGPCPKRIDICSCTPTPCSPCGGRGCGGMVFDLCGEYLFDGEGCEWRDATGEIVTDMVGRPPILAANICGTVHELEYGKMWVAEGDCIRLLCDIPGLRTSGRGTFGPSYDWQTNPDTGLGEWVLTDAGCPDSLSLHGMFGEPVCADLWDCLEDLVCWHWAQKNTACATSEDQALSVQHSGPDGSVTYRFADDDFSQWWQTTNKHLNRTLGKYVADECVGVFVGSLSANPSYRVHVTEIG